MTPRYWWRSRPSAVFLFPRNTSSSEKQGVGFHSGAKLENAARVRGEGWVLPCLSWERKLSGCCQGREVRALQQEAGV